MLQVDNCLFKASVILACTIIAVKCDIIREGKGPLPDALSLINLLSTFIKIFETPTLDGRRALGYSNPIEEAIDNKIVELQPYLQDEDDDEITSPAVDDKIKVVNIARNRDITLKNNIQKYRMIREIIHRKLTTETISPTTKSLIIKTLDTLIGTLMNSINCHARTNQHEDTSIATSHMFEWNEEWPNIEKNFISNIEEYHSKLQQQSDKNYKEFLMHVLRLFKYISKDIEELPKSVHIKCNKTKNSLEIEEANNNQPYLRVNNELNSCDQFVVCSHELKEFMLEVFEKVNETSISVIDNYVEMYNVDVNEENDDDKETLKAVLKKIRYSLENKVAKLFIDETKQFKLDAYKNREANIVAISNYVRQIIDRTQDTLIRALVKKFDGIKIKTVEIIKADIKANTEVELGNLAEDLTENICFALKFCNKIERVQKERDQKSYNNAQLKLADVTPKPSEVSISETKTIEKTKSTSTSTTATQPKSTMRKATRTTVKLVTK